MKTFEKVPIKVYTGSGKVAFINYRYNDYPFVGQYQL